MKPFYIEDTLIKPLKTYDISARVLGIERYRFDGMANVVPYDLALGWGVMSERRNLDHVNISQSKRWYFWRVDNFNNISRDQVEHNSANVHVIPANDHVFDKLSDLDEEDLVRMKGYLVSADSKDWGFKSSLTRYDVGGGSCELMYVESIEKLN